jgi:hemoglobin
MQTTDNSEKSIYEAIGGEAAVAAAVEVFYQRVLADPALSGYFAHTDMERLQRHQRAFFAMALRGPNQYSGQSMRAAHAGRGITDADFDRVAMHLVATLDTLGVPASLTEQIVQQIAPLRGEIVSTAAAA